MNTKLEQILFKELKVLIKFGETDEIFNTLISYLERSSPKLNKVWLQTLQDIQDKNSSN